MKKLLTAGCLFLGTPVVIVSYIAPSALGQEQNTARVEGPKLPPTIPSVVEWRFDQAQPDWKPTINFGATTTVRLDRTSDALRVTLSEGSRVSSGSLVGGVYVELPDWRREQWREIVVRARTTGSVNNMSVGLNPREGVLPPAASQPSPFAAFVKTYQVRGGVTPIVRDGTVRTYRIHLDWGSQRTGPWRRVGLQFHSPEPGGIEILSVRVVPAAAEQKAVTETMIQLPHLKSDFALFRRGLEEAHPGLYRYNTKRAVNAEFAKAQAKLVRPMTVLQFRNVLAPVVGAIKCGHTEFTSYPGDEISAVLNSAKHFPLSMKFESTRGFVVLNEGLDERVKPGMEVLAINGEPLAGILKRIIPNLPHDADIQTGQMYYLGYSLRFSQLHCACRNSFGMMYRLYIGNPASFKTTLRDPHTQQTVTLELAGVTNADAAANEEGNPVNRDVLAGIRKLQALGNDQSFRHIDGESTAILRLPGFRDFGDFLAKSFAELKGRRTKNLIIDLRENGGGRDMSIPLLFSYIAAKDFRIFDSVQVSTIAPTFRQHTDRDFTPATGFPEFSPAFGLLRADPNGGWFLTEKKSGNRLYRPLENPARISDEGRQPEKDALENHFDGAVYVLIDGGSFSAAADFPAIAAFHKRATFIGEETGGAAEGNNSGPEIGLTLPESQLHIGIPIYRYFNAVDKRDPRRGTLPTYAVTQSIEDLAKGRDTVLEFTRELIRSSTPGRSP